MKNLIIMVLFLTMWNGVRNDKQEQPGDQFGQCIGDKGKPPSTICLVQCAPVSHTISKDFKCNDKLVCCKLEHNTHQKESSSNEENLFRRIASNND
ncbi:hypothetical protein ILUMI_11858 [Ignelater luminosus]|uniref:Uncharacterized protein n=1 Tax=Ignelater luminosus TaxID=2038154 RepID=A0A8K0D453_IGNLU|nr:hypothetical protein ILUMI_11858 [Ignelater luminosus]